MQSETTIYHMQAKQDFTETLAWIKKKVDSTLAIRIEKTIVEKLSEQPLRTTGRIKNKRFKPMRYLKIGKRRLYFIACEECRSENLTKIWQCPECSTMPIKALMILDIDKRENAYNFD